MTCRIMNKLTLISLFQLLMILQCITLILRFLILDLNFPGSSSSLMTPDDRPMLQGEEWSGQYECPGMSMKY